MRLAVTVWIALPGVLVDDFNATSLLRSLKLFERHAHAQKCSEMLEEFKQI